MNEMADLVYETGFNITAPVSMQKDGNFSLGDFSVQKTYSRYLEEENIEKFKEINNNLYESAYNANAFANVIGPINAQLGNMSYVVCAIVGGALALGNVGGFTLGGLASFLTFNKSFNMPINQVSQQLNAIVMALAGAERIFRLMDEEPELDEGYVTLVNAKEENGKLTETPEHTGLWAWKHTHQADGSVDYKKLEGDVVFDDVDFGYVPEKIVLHDVDLFATPGQKIAFVGTTGAGKTTITNLINRFYDIKDGKIAEKRTLELPTELTDVLKCKNPRCITSTEQELPHIFRLTDREHRVYRCIYCETKGK